MNGYEAANYLMGKNPNSIPDLLVKLQRSNDSFEEDWQSAWDKYEEASEKLLELKEHLENMKKRFEKK
jgi:hypothetical protein